MKKTSKRPQRKKAQNASKPKNIQYEPVDSSKRSLLNNALIYGLSTAVVGGMGYWLVGNVRASMAEGDLSKIGNGVPAVVQIHDPQCSVCARLMRQTRTAIKGFESDELQYLVANIKTNDGKNLATQHSVPHVTLLLFDGSGRRVQTISGVQQSSYLKPIFSSLAKGKL